MAARRLSDCRTGPKPKLENPKPPSDREFKPANSTSDTEYTDDETEFMMAMDTYKREKGRPFPSWREVLMVLKGLGYCKPAAVVSMAYIEAIASRPKCRPGGKAGTYLKPKPKIRFEREPK
jgi:hypothetical protein